ncbi:blue-light photoreceptor PHR2-like [Telopea speciosissima]|uniref:blue-light photoreceptor PHR2-like n=1 Tax=Telopea speciosissima TaxID=54955 RepID=UPI001CC811CE|nr:blue-light photoreceptor PHR2-like [Telopea speciosissima]
MDANLRILEQPERKVEGDQEEIAVSSSKDKSTAAAAVATPPLSTASISLSLSTIIPTNFLLTPKPSSLLLSAPNNKVKIPSQISSLSHISLSSSLAPPKSSFSSTFSANPLQAPLSRGPRRSSEPSNLAGVRRSTIVWFRNDLRLHDNECINTANNESISVLPVYCFDPRDYGKSSSGFDKTGPYRATFLIESVSDLRRNLQSRGSDLVVRIGKPEIVLVELAKAIGADAVYAHKEVSHNEVQEEEKIEASMKEEGVEVKFFWGSTLYHVDDLPFKLEEMPSNYGGFKEKLQGLEMRKTIAALDQLKGLPARGDVEPGEIPTLLDLGLSPTATITEDGKPAANASFAGGETKALERLKKFAVECQAQPNKGDNSIYGANFSCKISPWLAMGCLSPRFMFDELKKSITRTISAASTRKDGGSGQSDTGMNWLMFELLWRDFFRFITKKYSSTKKQLTGGPATACTGALA